MITPRVLLQSVAAAAAYSTRSVRPAWAAAIAACGVLASAPASAQGVKIGVLADQSGTYADFDGKWSVEAAKMAVEDFGGSVLGQKIELIDADHQNKLDLATAIARRWYDVEGVDMITDLTLSSVALAVQAIAAERKKIDIVVASSTSALTGPACTPYGFHWAYDSHALAVSTGGALVKTGADTWFFITVDYAAGHALEKDASEHRRGQRGQGARPRALPAQHPRLLVLPLAGAKLEGEDCRSRHRRPRRHQCDQAGGGIRHRRRRPAARNAAADRGGSPRPWARSRAGSGADRELLLGPQRPDPRIRRALLQAHRADAEHGPGRHVFGDLAISQGGQGRRDEGRRRGRQEAEGAAGRRRLHCRTAMCRPMDAWCRTSICSRSRSRRKANATGTITICSRPCPATRPIRPPPTAAAH